MSPALYSTTMLPQPYRVVCRNPAGGRSERDLRYIAHVADYLQTDFPASYAKDLGWCTTASAVEAAARDARMMRHAVQQLDYFFSAEKRIIEPQIDGQFVPFI